MSRLFIPIILFALLNLIACRQSGTDSADIQRPDTISYRPRLDGIDISSHQRYIDWGKVAANPGLRFVYIKATEGSLYVSPHYQYNIRQARQRKLLVGSYHFMTTTTPIRRQVENFTRVVKADDQDLIPMIDIEDRGNWTRRQLLDSLALMTQLLERHYGCRPMIYSSNTFYNQNLSPQFNHYPLYIGRYSGSRPRISWRGDYTIWQFTETGIMSGFDTYVDQATLNPTRSIDEIRMPTQATNKP